MASRRELNDAAALLRTWIDRANDRLVDATASEDEANRITDPLYNAVTLLHEHATKEV